MKNLLLALLLVGVMPVSRAASTINPASKFSYGANIGWADWRGDAHNGAVLGEYVCSGFIYAANVGWINLGNGSPANGIRYQNNSGTDFGINHDGSGNLRGLAYGANIGWINFENSGAAKVDLDTGRLSGSIYSANVGWISLGNAFGFVQTDRIQIGADTDGDAIVDAWENTHTNSLAPFTSTSDSDADGISDRGEYLADTDPLDASSVLRIIYFSVSFDGENDHETLQWTTRPTRRYRLQHRAALNPNAPWITGTSLYSSPNATITLLIGFNSPSAQRYFRIEPLLPLP